jgi:hypothetical protein
MSDAVRRAVSAGRRSYLIFAVGVIATVAGAIACHDGIRQVAAPGAETVVHSSAAKDAPKGNPFAYVGEEHNAEVDYVLREFSKKWKKNMKKADVCAALNAITKKYLAMKGRSADVARFYAADDPCRDDQPSLIGKRAGLRTADVSYDPNFSTRAVDLVNEIQNIMLTSGSSGEVGSRLGPINAEAMGMGANDAALVLGVSSIAYSSAAYWEANLDTWVAIYSQGGDPGPLPFLRTAETAGLKTTGAVPQINWSGIGEVGWADVIGGAIGGLKGALAGPAGIFAGIGTGAAYSSIGAALGQILKIVQKI